MSTRSMIFSIFGIILLFNCTDVAGIPNGLTRRDAIGPVMRSIETLPKNIRAAVAHALSARGHDSGFLGTNGTPEVAPIIGGRDAPNHKYPWFARMVYFWNDRPYWTWCGASVYNERTIITAAHCVDRDIEQKDGFYGIHAGQYDPVTEEGLEQVALVDNIILHPGFHISGMFLGVDDIALMITDVPLNFTTIAVRPIPRLSTSIGDEMALKSNNCVVMGYGLFALRPEALYADILQELSPVTFVSNRYCHEETWKKADLSVTPKMICTINQGAGTSYIGKPRIIKDRIDKEATINLKRTSLSTCWVLPTYMCLGDSGGPVGCYDNDGVFFQVGIVSWGDGGIVKVYTRISKYRRWIKWFSYRV